MELNDPQREAVVSHDGPLLILAGAGCGKTRVITYRIAHMLRQGVPADAILALTFTNKAAREMAGRVATLTRRRSNGPAVSTFHAFGARFLREHIRLLGFRPNFSIYDSSDRQALLREVAAEQSLDARNLDLRLLEQQLSALKTGRDAAPTEIDLRGLLREYQAHLKSHNAVDFDDLITMPLRMLDGIPEVLEQTQGRYLYLLVDEFQDTSAAQYRLLRRLAEKSRNVCVVGDDDQSIYSWRGASYQNIVDFERDFPDRRLVTLEQNYRSTRCILQAANALISRNLDRKSKRLWTAGDRGEPIRLMLPEDEQAEGEMIAARIKSLLERYPPPQ